MRQIMGAIGSPGGGNLLFKLPGFKQFAQMQQLKGMNMGDMMSQFGLDGGGMPGGPGLPGLPGDAGHGARPDSRYVARSPKGYLPPGTPGGVRKSSSRTQKAKKASRKKNKQARASRRKQRKK